VTVQFGGLTTLILNEDDTGSLGAAIEIAHQSGYMIDSVIVNTEDPSFTPDNICLTAVYTVKGIDR
jgi:hypothetical protein